MRRHRVVIVLAGAAVLCAAPAAVSAARAARVAGWHMAIEVPGLGSLNAGGDAGLTSLSCGLAGNCAAAGFYSDGSGHRQAFVVNEQDGKWGTAIEVPGSESLNAGGLAIVTSVSCASSDNCAAGGFYTDGAGREQAFALSERNGRWGTAKQVRGTRKLNKGGRAWLVSVSCAAAADCAAGGFYTDSSGHAQVFVLSEKNGRWGKARQVAGLGALNKGGDAGLGEVSCAAADTCAAAGAYRDGSAHLQGFVVSRTKGTWGRAIEVPGLAALNAGMDAAVLSVSCASPGNCAAAGTYRDSSAQPQAFVVSERDGTWRSAIEVPGLATLNVGGNASVISVSCVSVGNCAAGGYYTDRSGDAQAFAAIERNGRWRKARQVPGSGALNKGNAELTSVSCASAGNCVAGGLYTDGMQHFQAFVVSQTNGIWGTAIEVPGSATLNQGGFATVSSVSCRSGRDCAAAGTYRDSSGRFEAYVVSHT